MQKLMIVWKVFNFFFWSSELNFVFKFKLQKSRRLILVRLPMKLKFWAKNITFNLKAKRLPVTVPYAQYPKLASSWDLKEVYYKVYSPIVIVWPGMQTSA